jgi:hypothetical protein
MTTTRTAYPKIYRAERNGRTFWIDGYTGEWKVLEGPSPVEAEWWETLPTKRDAVQYIEDQF